MPTTLTGQNGASGQAEHEDRGHGLPEGEEEGEGQAREEAQGDAKKGK